MENHSAKILKTESPKKKLKPSENYNDQLKTQEKQLSDSVRATNLSSLRENNSTNFPQNYKKTNFKNSDFLNNSRSLSQSFAHNFIEYQKHLKSMTYGNLENENNNLTSSVINLKSKKTMNLSMDSTMFPQNLSSSVIQLATKDEDLESEKRIMKKVQIEKGTRELYYLSFTQREISEKIKEEFNKATIQKEKEICSFKPLILAPKKEIDSEILKMGFNERREQLKQRFAEKHEKIKNDKSKLETDACTFKPDITRLSLPKPKKLSENKVLKKFFERQKQAQSKKQEDKLIIDSSIRLKPNINEVYDRLYSKNLSKSVKNKEEEEKNKKPNKGVKGNSTIKLEQAKLNLRNQLQAINSISVISDIIS